MGADSGTVTTSPSRDESNGCSSATPWPYSAKAAESDSTASGSAAADTSSQASCIRSGLWIQVDRVAGSGWPTHGQDNRVGQLDLPAVRQPRTPQREVACLAEQRFLSVHDEQADLALNEDAERRCFTARRPRLARLEFGMYTPLDLDSSGGRRTVFAAEKVADEPAARCRTGQTPHCR